VKLSCVQTFTPKNTNQKQKPRRKPRKKGRKAAINADYNRLEAIANRIHGRGDYKQVVKQIKGLSNRFKVASRLGATAGRYLSPSMGVNASVGSQIGRNLGMTFSKVTGWGDYDVAANTLVRPSAVPDFGTQSIRVTHKEYLGNVIGSTDFASTIYRLNPGISDSFPWLAGIARNYQQYRFNGMLFQFVSTSAFALNSINSALGKVILATNYNAEDPAFDSTVAMLSTQFSNYGRPAESLTHAIECAPQETPDNVYYIRTDLEQKGKDLRFTDLGFVQLATEGMQSDSEVGGLWVTYDVTFLKPIINQNITLDVGIDQFIVECNTDDLYAGNISIRNNKLAGGLVVDGKQAIYTFNAGISSGTYVLIEEYDVYNAEAKVFYSGGPNWIGSNCEMVLDDDLNGPFNSRYQDPVGSEAGRCVDTFSLVDSTNAIAVRSVFFKITGPRPSFTSAGLSLAGPRAWVRYSILPISYDKSPDGAGPPLPP
jgi:hypothetical protein